MPISLDGEPKLLSIAVDVTDLAAILRQGSHVMHGLLLYGVKTATVTELEIAAAAPTLKVT